MAPERDPAHRLPRGAVILLLLLCVAWGGNMVAIKVSVGGVAPAFAAALRSLVSGVLVYGWMRLRGVPAVPNRQALLHGAVVGVLFGLEFGCIYLGLKYTLASRSSILLYTHPFFVALGAHYLLGADRLHARKVLGLLLAFAGVVLLFRKGLAGGGTGAGDLLILTAAVGWAATTVYIKRFLTGRAVPLQTLFYQLAFSAPVLFAWSAVTEERVWYGLTPAVVAALLYQCLVVAFVSYIVWFELIHRYSVSVLAAFTFFTPVFGVLLSALLLPGDKPGAAVFTSLALVCLGTVLVNRPAPGS